MKEPDWSCCTEEDLWKYVGWHLAECGMESVLVGGSVVAVYSSGAYQSGDLDLILEDGHRAKVETVMSRIGFVRKGRHFEHPCCRHLFVEMPPGPLAIGDDYNISPASIEVEGKRLLILSPTDCIKNRLASYIHWNVRDGLDQAVLVARAREFDDGEVRRWCEREGGLEPYREFRREFAGE